VQYRRSVAVRYRGQSHELDVVLSGRVIDEAAVAQLREDFYQRLREAFGVVSRGAIEIVNLRVRATVAVPHARFARPFASVASAPATTRDAWFGELGGFVPTPVHQLGDTESGTTLMGPALIEAPESTILVPPSWAATVDPSGAVLLNHSSTGGRRD
jgi:N-methylhydantoinase A